MKIEEILKTNSSVAPAKKIVLNLLFTQNMIVEKLSEALKAYDLSIEQFNVLRILKGQNGKPAHMSLIQERMLAKTSNTTRLVDKLLNKEFVNREICSDNRRKMEITITEKGLDVLKIVSPIVDNIETLYAQNLTPEEIATLNLLLEKYRNN